MAINIPCHSLGELNWCNSYWITEINFHLGNTREDGQGSLLYLDHRCNKATSKTIPLLDKGMKWRIEGVNNVKGSE
jgi:hypothetical protein